MIVSPVLWPPSRALLHDPVPERRFTTRSPRKNRRANGHSEPQKVATSFPYDDSMCDYITKTLFFARRPDE